MVGLLLFWEVSKGPAIFGWQHKMSLLHAATTKETNKPVMWSSVEEFFPCLPPSFPDSGLYFATDKPAAPPRPTSLRNFLVTHPCNPFGPVVMVTSGSEMAFHSGKVVYPHSPRSLPLTRSRTFPSQRSFIVVKESLPAANAPLAGGARALLLPDGGWCSTRRRLGYRFISPSAVRASVFRSDEQQTALCSTSTVKSQPSLCESRWLPQSEKCLEFAIQGLWASSCVAFFPSPLALFLQLCVCSLGQGLRV